MSRYHVGTESGETINANGIVHGARYGLDVESADEEGAVVIDGELYRPIEDDGSEQ